MRVLLFNIIGDRDPKVLMAPFLVSQTIIIKRLGVNFQIPLFFPRTVHDKDCGFHYAAFTPNIVFPNGNPTGL